MPIRVIHVGLGPIGSAVARQVAGRKGFKIVGAVDIDPEKAGRDLGEVVGLGAKTGVQVSADLARAIKAAKPDIAVLCTRSSLAATLPQIEAILGARVPIVSTTEELAYPSGANKRLGRKVDASARRARVAVLGTGVNPGFAMDTLPIVLTGVCERVESITVERVQDASIRRLPFQQKIGAGLSPAEFARRVEAGTVRHVGLTESISMIADAFGWPLERITDDIGPKVATAAVASQYLRVEAGAVAGIIQDGVGYRDGKPVIRLHMEAYLGAPESFDAVRVEGSPPLSMKIAGGIQGDIATASIVVNSIPKVLAAAPGLRTMRDLPIPSFFGGNERRWVQAAAAGRTAASG
jgi:4-hydroxy-tetrahydrodipicolinate reductase